MSIYSIKKSVAFEKMKKMYRFNRFLLKKRLNVIFLMVDQLKITLLKRRR